MAQIIKEFNILGLFNSVNVNLKFDELENIYIGENGLGKTTILSTIFYTLTKRFSELSKVEFNTIEITFGDNDIYKVTKDDIMQYFNSKKRLSKRMNISLYKFIQNNHPNKIKEIMDLKNEFGLETAANSDLFTNLVDELDKVSRLRKSYLTRQIIDFTRLLEFEECALAQLEKKLDKILEKHEILYFPTFRRIEEDITKLRAFSEDKESIEFVEDDDLEDDIKSLFSAFNEDSFTGNGELIKFGMKDVNETIDKLLREISENSISSFNQMTAILLKQYVNNEISKIKNDEKINLNNLKISLDRVGSEIEDYFKERIIDLVKNGQIYSKENSYLLNFIRNLLASHEQLRTIDKRIEDFVSVCNTYLVNKKFRYDASKVKLPVMSNTGNRIKLKDLSSGEKQIISTFSKIYLEHEKNYIILFDEPELSLSIKWQEQYIPDIIRSGNCSLLICVTHSPFIFKEDRLFDISKEILKEIEIIEDNKNENHTEPNIKYGLLESLDTEVEF
ncbi:AAA family ATPase [Bacillus halotolerans]|uniref:AAA family ATPase n=1 Tax=Bacillus halotolerans TaxID=260554 RepID=UPI00192C6954|nr:AAA family ATPase [Bacillus halotolerans]MBL4966865.1 AAA family ATPase [Bacillus halotolerans]MBL4970899.1 AAA family ATPase [Bacillus halotolerans]